MKAAVPRLIRWMLLSCALLCGGPAGAQALDAAAWARVPPHPRLLADDAIVRRAQREEKPRVQAAASRVYDQYLRANRVQA